MFEFMDRNSKADKYSLLQIQDEAKSEITYQRGFYLSLMSLIGLVTVVSMYWSWENVSHFASWSSLFAGVFFIGVTYMSMRDCMVRLSVRLQDINRYLSQ
ncbi:hypothetical protein [Piscirickettsia litoralis]|uniref:Uncharacterized protein n=1 Tax=Piscirickettsia litoralis TaxID=1891921 RepID=A0ABX3A1D9_9GAMM|nr:hypothetical protein [Piscirickettsia litoralis]ODN42258.1 hypothetical protein BGC07_04040 [Piscirickettsia litoralis]